MIRTTVITAMLAVLLQSAQADDPAMRPFRLGFTRWPADITAEGFQTTAARPWGCRLHHVHRRHSVARALDGKPFSKDVQNNLAYRPPGGTKVFLSISPLDKDRKNLAPYRHENDNQPLPADWKDRALNSPEVKKAFLNFCTRSVEALEPDWLAIGIESNVLLSHDRTKWEQLKELHRETYQALKQKFPELPVFFTTELLHYKKLAADARKSDQQGEVCRIDELQRRVRHECLSAHELRRSSTGTGRFLRLRNQIRQADSGFRVRNDFEGR